MGRLTDAMTSVVRLEVQHQQVSMAMSTLREKQDATEKRVDALERLMPGLVETRKWIVGWLVAGVGVVGLALLAVVMKVPT